MFLANSGRFCGRGATLLCRYPFLRPNKFRYVGLFNENLTERNVLVWGDFGRVLTDSGVFVRTNNFT